MYSVSTVTGPCAKIVKTGSDSILARNGLGRGSGMERGRKIQQRFVQLHFVNHHELPLVTQRRDVFVEQTVWSAMYCEFSDEIGQGNVTE
jgi:hypothetical protein